MDWVSRVLAECTPWSYVVLFGQVVVVAILVERFVYLKLTAAVNAELFMAQIRKLVLAGNEERAQKLAAALPNSPLGRVCRAGLASLDKQGFVLQEELDRAVAEETPKVGRRLPNLLLFGLGVGVVGVVGSWQLGAGAPALGGGGPLPLGLSVEQGPGLLGAATAVLALLFWLLLSRSAASLVRSLETCRQQLLDLAAERAAMRK